MAAAAGVFFLAGCSSSGSSSSSSGGGGGGNPPPPPVANTQAVVVDQGPIVGGQPVGNNNILYTTVTLCVPGSTTCQTIDHIQVDTGATGLRILGSVLTLPLTPRTDASNNPIGNCINYADSTFQWGPVASADIKMAGEVASSVPIQIAGANGFAAPPAACSSGGTEVDTVTDLGANGILGVGIFRQDCGSPCANPNENFAYFACPATGCVLEAVALTGQLQNPVWLFPQDNNGLMISLPAISSTGALSANGNMIFGIGTQSDNSLNSAQVEMADNTGSINVTYNGTTYSGSFIDTGSNGYFFLDSQTTQLPDCSNNTAPGFYCPNNPVLFNVITRGTNVGVAGNPTITVGNAATLINSPNYAFNDIGGSNPGSFDFGLPFFFGRPVFIGIEGQFSSSGVGPYWAF